MKINWTSSSLFIIKFLLSLFIIGIIIGFYTYYNQSEITHASIAYEIENISQIITGTRANNFIMHIIIFSVGMLLSLIVIGIPFIIFYFFYEAVSIGFLLASFFSNGGVEGLFFGLIFMIINKLFIYIIILYLILFSIQYAKRIINGIRKKDYRISNYITNQIIKNIIIIIAVLIFDVFIFFLGNMIISYFLFLIST